MRLLNVFALMFLFLFGTKLATSAEAAKEPQALPVPMLRAINPESAKPGELVTVSGENLDKSRVTELYLTNGKVDLKVTITDQAATAIKFKVPEKAAPGRYTMMVLLPGEEPKLLEEPIHFTVE
jgi:hypothetical protein